MKAVGLVLLLPFRLLFKLFSGTIGEPSHKTDRARLRIIVRESLERQAKFRVVGVETAASLERFLALDLRQQFFELLLAFVLVEPQVFLHHLSGVH